MITIGGKKVILSTLYMASDEQDAEIDVPLDDGIFTAIVRFRPREQQKTHNVQWISEGRKVRISITGWDNPLGTGLKVPVEIGKSEGLNLYFQLASHRMGDLNVVYISFYKGDRDA